MKHLRTYEEINYGLAHSCFAEIDPMDSIFRKRESEIVAKNIMVILSRTGNKWRELSWDEYKKERLKDGDFSEEEKYFFDQVKKFCNSEENAYGVSSAWKNMVTDMTKKYNL